MRKGWILGEAMEKKNHERKWVERLLYFLKETIFINFNFLI